MFQKHRRPARAGRYGALTETRPGTPTGDWLRRYWQPVALTSALPQGRGYLALRVMGQDLQILRDAEGRLQAWDRSPSAGRCFSGRSYPVQEASGAIWIFLGTGKPPTFAAYPAAGWWAMRMLRP